MSRNGAIYSSVFAGIGGCTAFLHLGQYILFPKFSSLVPVSCSWDCGSPSTSNKTSLANNRSLAFDRVWNTFISPPLSGWLARAHFRNFAFIRFSYTSATSDPLFFSSIKDSGDRPNIFKSLTASAFVYRLLMLVYATTQQEESSPPIAFVLISPKRENSSTFSVYFWQASTTDMLRRRASCTSWFSLPLYNNLKPLLLLYYTKKNIYYFI